MIDNLQKFMAPAWEVSLFKGIPITEYTPQTMKQIRQSVGVDVRVKFRGPRPVFSNRSALARRGTCLKKDARTFTVYVR